MASSEATQGGTQSITITPSAREELKRIMSDEGMPEGAALRLFVQGGGCSGFSYGMRFEEESQENDRELDVDGLRVLMDPKSYLFLRGIVMDFKKSLMGRGFVFENPNAKGHCGCGTSFSM